MLWDGSELYVIEPVDELQDSLPANTPADPDADRHLPTQGRRDGSGRRFVRLGHQHRQPAKAPMPTAPCSPS